MRSLALRVCKVYFYALLAATSVNLLTGLMTKCLAKCRVSSLACS